MRDPARIDRIVELLREAWSKESDQRLGQLLDNITDISSNYRSTFRLQEDDKWEQQLRNWIIGR